MSKKKLNCLIQFEHFWAEKYGHGVKTEIRTTSDKHKEYYIWSQEWKQSQKLRWDEQKKKKYTLKNG